MSVMSAAMHLHAEGCTHVSACDNYLVCVDVSPEIFLCLSSGRASSPTRPGLCG